MKPCVFKDCSTTPELKLEMPAFCKKKGCDGTKKMCDLYQPEEEGIRKEVADLCNKMLDRWTVR